MGLFVAVRGETEGFTIVVFVGPPGDAERGDALEERVTKAWDGETFLAVGHVGGEIVGGVVSIGQLMHLVALGVNLLAGPGQGVAFQDIF